MRVPARRRRRWLACCAVLAACCAAPAARAQDEGPVVVGQDRRFRKVYFAPPNLSLNLLARYTESTASAPGAREQKITETLFEEILEAETTGFVLHPNFIDIGAAGSFGLRQTQVDTTGELGGDSGDATVYEFDARATLLREGNAPLTLYANRTIDLINQPFGPTLETTNETYGATWEIRSEKLPTYFNAYHVNSLQTTVGEELDYEYTQDAFQWQTVWNASDNQKLTWEYQFESTQQGGDAAINDDSQSHDATLTHAWDFGQNKRSNLSSMLNYYNETGYYPYDRLRFSENLYLHHSDTFQTRHSYDYNEYSFEKSDSVSHRFHSNFTHRLYQSLWTTGNVGYSTIDYNGGESSTDDLFADLNFEYRKKVPLGEWINTLSGAWSQQSSDDRSAAIEVRSQSQTFEGFSPIIFTQPGLDPNSIVIREPALQGGRIYREGLDYSVRPFDDRVEVRRVGTAIPSGDPVLFDYTLDPQGANDITTVAFGFSTRYEIEEGFLRGLSPYARYLVQQQSVSGGGANIPVANDVTDTTFGAEYQWQGLTLRTEYQMHDSTILPYDAWRFSADYLRNLGLDSTFALHAAHDIIDYSEESRRSETTTVSGQLAYRLSRRLTAAATVTWLNQADDIGGDTTGLEEELSLTWTYRQTSVYGLFRNSNLETDDQETNYMVFQLGIERRF